MSHESEPEGRKKKEPEPAKKEPEPAKKDQLRNTACHPEALGRKKERVFSPGKGKSGKGERGGKGLGKVYICCLVLLNSLQMAGIGYGPCTLKISPAAMKKRFKKTHTQET